MAKNSIKNVLKRIAIIVLPVFLSVIASFVVVYYQVQKEQEVEFYKDFLNTLNEYGDMVAMVDSMQYRRLYTDGEIDGFEGEIADAAQSLEKVNISHLRNQCIIAEIYDSKLAKYCNNIVKTIYARVYGTNNLDFSNDYCDKPDYNTKEVQELLTYGWNESQKFKDIRSKVTLEFIKDSDLCYLSNKKDYKGQDCANRDGSCYGIDGLASGMDYLTLLIIYSNYQNIVYHISNIV